MARDGATAHAHREPTEIRRLDRMNLGVLVAQTTGWAACLWLGSHIDNGWLLALLSVFFCLMMRGVFSMMHEAFHGHAHSNSRINDAICWVSLGTVRRICNVDSHQSSGSSRPQSHARGLVDFVTHDESRLTKTLAYYFAIFGGIWLASAVGSLLTLIAARVAAPAEDTRRREHLRDRVRGLRARRLCADSRRGRRRNRVVADRFLAARSAVAVGVAAVRRVRVVMVVLQAGFITCARRWTSSKALTICARHGSSARCS